MNFVCTISIMVLFAAIQVATQAAENAAARESSLSHVIEAVGRVEASMSASGPWLKATNGMALSPGNRVRTGPDSRAAVQLSDRSVIRLNQNTTLEIQPPRFPEQRRFRLPFGSLLFLNREKPSSVEFETPLVSGAIRGTEFVLEAGGETAATRLMLFEGAVDLMNEWGRLAMEAGNEAVVIRGKPPVASVLVQSATLVQWSLHYPVVFLPEDGDWAGDDKSAMKVVLWRFREGDLAGAMEAMNQVGPGERLQELFRASLLLAAGRVDRAEAILGAGEDQLPGERALREILNVVRHGVALGQHMPVSGGEWMARSYRYQAAGKLKEARDAAREALKLAPTFGYTHLRLAEMELALDRRREATHLLNRAQEISPSLPGAHSLRGFIQLADGQIETALVSFRAGIEGDSSNSDSWMGKGIAEHRLGRLDDALRSFHAAAAMEPRRAMPRAYLGRIFSETGFAELARKDIELAKSMDPNDPTPWLHSALHASQYNLPNRAVIELAESVARNDNRRVYRSRNLLDQDLSVRSANQAAIYRDAGLAELGVRAAGRAVLEDYASFSAHLLLANAYQTMEDPYQFELRHEPARQSELLVANLLAPPGAGNLSQVLSQQEHLQFLNAKPVGGSIRSRYRSSADWENTMSLFGSGATFGYALDVEHLSIHGEALNDTLDRFRGSIQYKQQIRSSDEFYLQVGGMHLEAGDISRRPALGGGNDDIRVREQQIPNLLVGWHHSWSPSHQTMAVVARIDDQLRLLDPDREAIFLRQRGGDAVDISTVPFFSLRSESRFQLYSGEIQHLWSRGRQTWIAGVRGQLGEMEAESVMSRVLQGDLADQTIREPMRRGSGYLYHHWNPLERVRIVSGGALDHLEYPANLEEPPLVAGTRNRNRFTPKFGILATPWKDSLWRIAWTRSLGGVVFDQSLRLEPSQVAGFNQSFRSLLPESVAGLIPGQGFETMHAGIDQSWKQRTFFGVEAEILESHGDRLIGVFTNSLPIRVPDSPSSLLQDIRFRERRVAAYAVQLMGEGAAAGIRHTVTESSLSTRYPTLPSGLPGADTLGGAGLDSLHKLELSLLYRHASGFFGRWESSWHHPVGSTAATDSKAMRDFWNHNVSVGFRWPRNRAEIAVSILNLSNSPQRIPLTIYLLRQPSHRTLAVQARFNF